MSLRPSSESVARVAFVLSVAVLAFVYGDATQRFGWFPNELVDRAWRQAVAAFAPGAPENVHERVYDRTGARTVAPDAVQPGLTLVTSSWATPEGFSPGLRLIDREGRVVHGWRVDAGDLFTGSRSGPPLGLDDLDLHGSHLLPNGDVLVNVDYAGTVRVDACGEVRWRLAAGNHHSIVPAGDGTFWIPGVTSEPRSASPAHPGGLPGLDRPVYQDLILRVAADGAVLDTIHLLDVLHENGLWHHVAKSRAPRPQDPTHLNDVEPLPAPLADEYPLFEAGDLVISLRNLDLVLVLDPRSGRVKWHASEPFVMQHDPDFLGDGWIGVFDNRRDDTDRGTMLGGSRIVALQPHTDSVRVLFPGPASDPFYTHHRGKWQRLENGNLLLVESAAGRIVEVAPDGRTVWEWIAEPYEGWGVPSVSGGERVDVTPEEVAGWPCAGGGAP